MNRFFEVFKKHGKAIGASVAVLAGAAIYAVTGSDALLLFGLGVI